MPIVSDRKPSETALCPLLGRFFWLDCEALELLLANVCSVPNEMILAQAPIVGLHDAKVVEPLECSLHNLQQYHLVFLNLPDNIKHALH